MKTLTIRNRFQSNSTMVENEFIDVHMIKANGEFVKVYLFLLRHLNNPCSSVTISTIADCLQDTERDIMRALKYWESEGLLSILYDEEKKIVGLEFSTPSTTTGPLPKISATSVSDAIKHPIAVTAPVKPRISSTNTTSSMSKKKMRELVFVAEQYLGKTLSSTDHDTLSYFCDTLHFSADLIEYLVEYCVENGHKSMHYIQSVALAWYDNGIHTVEEAQEHAKMYNKNYYTVLKAFGITGRGPAVAEQNWINTWINEYGFTLDIIKEACNRTIATIHQPSFDYADSILKNWISKGVHHLTDIQILDETYQKEKASKKSSSQSSKTTKSNNFKARAYDYQSLEEQLLSQQAKETASVTQ